MKAAILELPDQETIKPEKRKRDRGSGMLMLRGKTWWIQYYANGRQVRQSTRSSVRQVAVSMLQRRLTEAKDGNIADGRLRYEAMRDYLYQDYETHGRKSLFKRADGTPCIGPVPALDEFFKDYRVAAITTEAIKKFIRKRQDEGIGNGGINGSLAMLRRMFWLQVKERKFPRNLVPHFPMLEKPKGRRDFLTPEQNAALLAHLPDDLKALQVIAYDTGARKGELLKLTWDDVDIEKGSLLFRDTKNGEDRNVPLGAQAIKTLHALRAANPGNGLVFTRGGKPIKNFRSAWEKALAAAGIPGKHLFHGNRRSQAVNLMASDVDEQTAMSLTGHKDTKTFREYRVLVEEAKRAAIAKRDATLKNAVPDR